MRRKLLRLLTVLCFILTNFCSLKAQNCIPTNINGSIINRTCSQICDTLKFQIPHIKSSGNYKLVSIPFNPYPFNTATGNEDPAIYADDFFSNVINLPFTFCFYGAGYSSAVVGSNGIMTFDISNASCANSWPITQPIPYAGGAMCNSPNTYYPKASVMGAYSDLDPRIGASSNKRKIQWEVSGTAPCRKFVVSYSQVGVFGVTAGICQAPANTFQIVLHESTGIIEIFILQKACVSTTNNGHAILGIQNWNRDQAIAAPGKNNSVWNENNTAYSFIPSAGVSRYVVSEIFTMSGTLVSTADTATTTPGLLDLKFPHVCSSGASNKYVVRTTFSACENAAVQLISYDTITIKTDTIQAVTFAAATSCSEVNNGAIKVTPVTGTAPYTFKMDNSPAVSGPSPYTFSNLVAGPHEIIVIDAAGCTTSPIIVNVPAGLPLTTTMHKTDAACKGSATGSITIDIPATGTGPFTYSIDGATWQNSPVFSGLPAGNYTVSYRDKNGCRGSQIINIDEPMILNSVLSSKEVICNGQGNGSISVKTTGGIKPYDFSIDGGINWRSDSVFNVGAGTFTVITRDANKCIATQNVIVTEPPAISISSVNSDASCNGGNDGTISISASGGNTGGYQYSVDGSAFQGSNIIYTGPGNHLVTVKDNLGCTNIFNTTVGLINDLIYSTHRDTVICQGTSVQLNVVSNGIGYSWAPATGLDDSKVHNPVASPVATTQYVVTINLGNCTGKDTIIVNVLPAPIPDAGENGNICYGQSLQLQASGGVRYSWSPTTYLDNASIATPVSSAPHDMVYSVKILSDANGCASLKSDEMELNVTQPFKLFTFPADTIVYTGDKFQLRAFTEESDVHSYTWSPANGLNNSGISDPEVTAGSNGNDQIYTVIASTTAGCKAEATVHLKVYKGPDIYMPTGFTPNDDGKNDQFIPYPVGIKAIKNFNVFNRWGQLIFHTNQIHKGWDGKVQGKLQPVGTYVWIIEAVTNQDKIIIKKGTVTLIR